MKQEVKSKQDASRVADIVGTLVVLNRGNFVIDAGREFQEVVDGIIATNKSGEINIKLKVTPSGWDRDTAKPIQVDVQPEITAKIPKPDQAKSIFFLTEENKLTRDEIDRAPLFMDEKEPSGR